MTTASRLPTTNATNSRNWRDDAACRNVDPDLFFPVGYGPASQQQAEEAKQICRQCPVQARCLQWALETRQAAGVWGGMTESERYRLARTETTQLDVCWDNRAVIEAWVAAGKSQRQIGAELGVGHWAVKRALAAFQTEDAMAVNA